MELSRHEEHGGDIVCYPWWPECDQRPQYRDLEKRNGRCKDPSDESKCQTDHGKKGETWTEGIFVVVCKHLIVYGWHVMLEPESPSDVFTLLLTRIPPTLYPKLVFYDNGCKVHEYTTNRRPSMLKQIKFLVDSFHFGHIQKPIHACPRCFYAKDYPEHERKLPSL